MKPNCRDLDDSHRECDLDSTKNLNHMLLILKLGTDANAGLTKVHLSHNVLGLLTDVLHTSLGPEMQRKNDHRPLCEGRVEGGRCLQGPLEQYRKEVSCHTQPGNLLFVALHTEPPSGRWVSQPNQLKTVLFLKTSER